MLLWNTGLLAFGVRVRPVLSYSVLAMCAANEDLVRIGPLSQSVGALPSGALHDAVLPAAQRRAQRRSRRAMLCWLVVARRHRDGLWHHVRYTVASSLFLLCSFCSIMLLQACVQRARTARLNPGAEKKQDHAQQGAYFRHGPPSCDAVIKGTMLQKGPF